MNRRYSRFSPAWRIGLLLLALCSTSWSRAQAEVRSIQEFMVFKEKWENFVITGYVWQLEGRYALISDGTLTFANCPLPFRITTEQANSRGNSGVVEVTGKIVQEEKGLAFQVDELVPRPRDLERLKSMRFGIDTQQAQQWYRVAEWARGRGTFYNDRELFNSATDLDRNGVLTELRQLQPGDERGLAILLEKAREKKLDEALIQQMIHDSLQARFFNIRNKKSSEVTSAAFRELRDRIQHDLPGARTPLLTFPVAVNTEYLADPKVVYATATPEQRLQLDRLFFVAVRLADLLPAVRTDGSNGFEIADRLRAEIPERKELIEKYEQQAIDWRMKKIDISTRSQLDEFIARLEQSGRKELAMEAKQKWLAAREPYYRQDGARGLTDFAQQWMSLLGDESMAARLNIEAWRVNPQYVPATDWLSAHGYRQFQQTWMLESEIAKMPVSPREQAIRDGRVETGMTATEVQAALGSIPSSITRLASRQQITEWWTYRDAGVVVQLVKSNRDRESSVIKVEHLSEH